MNSRKQVLIGPMFADPGESVSSVNRNLVSGLSGRFDFIYSVICRRHGATRRSALTLWNLWYSLHEGLLWLWKLLVHRPDIAHYAVGSGWAMEKGLILLMFARWMGVATFGHLHSGGFLDHWRMLPGWRRAFALRQIHKLDGFIVLSKWWLGEVSSTTGLPASKLWVVNNPIDPDFMKAALSIPLERMDGRILSLGTMGRDKGVHDLIAACGILRREGTRFRLDLVGPERETGVKAEAETGLRREGCADLVSVVDGAYGEEKLSCFRNAAVFVLPSYYENYPLVLLEAAFAGLAIVTTAVGAVPEMFQDGVSALFVNPGDPRELAKALGRLLRDPSERARLAAEARSSICRNHDSGRILDSLADAYQSVPARQRCRRAGRLPSLERKCSAPTDP